MQILDGEDDLSCIELSLFLGKTLLFGKQAEELTTRTVLEGEEELLFVLEGVEKPHDEGVVHSH